MFQFQLKFWLEPMECQASLSLSLFPMSLVQPRTGRLWHGNLLWQDSFFCEAKYSQPHNRPCEIKRWLITVSFPRWFTTGHCTLDLMTSCFVRWLYNTLFKTQVLLQLHSGNLTFCWLENGPGLNWRWNIFLLKIAMLSLKLTAKAPENGWLEYDRFLLGPRPIFRGVCC